jgi:ubiquinone/menaquinone biosynthesis C-methylase UbiE
MFLHVFAEENRCRVAPADTNRCEYMTPETIKVGTDIEAMERLIPLPGRRIVDVAGGDGALAFALAERGASVLALQNDPESARVNRALGSFQRVTLVEGFAQNLPQNDGTVDCVIFADCLSRIEAHDMDDCLAEACRVLKENDGLLYVLEQDTSGLFDGMIRMFDGQSAVRAWASGALLRMPQHIFASAREIHYSLKRQFPDFGSFVAKFMSAENISYALEDVNNADVNALFEQGKNLKGAGYGFEHEMRVNLYRTGPAPTVSA